MSADLPAPTARRLSAPSWKDSRLLVGVVLVLASVVVGALAIGAADERVGVWAAASDMTPGDPVRESDLVRVDVSLGDQAGKYLQTGREFPQGATVDRELRQGELVPRSALIDRGDLTVFPTVVHVPATDLSGLAKGSRVAIYAAAPLTSQDKQAGRRPEYTELLSPVTVHRVPTQGGTVIGGSSADSSVELLIPEDEVERVLSADTDADPPLRVVANGGTLAEVTE
ncbi:hypothetical protein [Janibacter melonis]|uniref:hypothetical protein n=1 Tax=Janibacter melonis TaxID=262209 RepID=UPI00209411CA|nr:hypothetical protein [Janibacter melonis]